MLAATHPKGAISQTSIETDSYCVIAFTLVFILNAVVSLVGGLAAVHFIDLWIDPRTHKESNILALIKAELFFIASPSIIMAVLGFLSATAAVFIFLVCALMFFVVLAITRGNIVEAFVMTAMVAILLPQLVHAGSGAYDAYQRQKARTTRLEIEGSIQPNETIQSTQSRFSTDPPH